ncbi:gastrula zinc finger protein XlCGF57.1-like isoform X2 [Venturia canescens]|uniref:gastrula zinc finger protein XlCGF57.1-like isoform X2 n=1 Tax=Venturia canescens TaxID=32260 RepID=UPI001C9C318B|nr:gastrula zinc finger protein XlCGF57.1-like isoform X2 [Venturia canescens]
MPSVAQDDGLPASICQSCRDQVDKFNDFRLLIEISDKALRSYLDGVQDSQKNCEKSQNINDSKSKKFKEQDESLEDPQELYAVDTIYVPSKSGTEVWRICSIEGDEEENELTQAETQPAIQASNKVLKKNTSQKVTLIQGKQPLFFTTINSEDNERVTNESEQITCISIMEEENYEEFDPLTLSLNKYSCELCLKSFKTLRTLKSHVKDHFLGGKEKIQICEMEKKNMRSLRSLKNSCGKSDSTKTKECFKKRGEIDPVTCKTCKRVFESEEKLLCARIQNRKTTNTGHDNKSCKECGNEITDSSNLNHDQALHEDSSLTCATCNKHFRNAQSYKMHLKRHTLGCRFTCVECGKCYYSNSELARHMQLHTGMREYPCSLCQMSFFSKPELNRHTKYHNGEKKFQCKICLKSYYESGHLKVHQRVHTGEKPFPCTVCSKAFITKSKLIRHFKVHERNHAT